VIITHPCLCVEYDSTVSMCLGGWTELEVPIIQWSKQHFKGRVVELLNDHCCQYISSLLFTSVEALYFFVN
jgi:hypothetical protein